MGNLSYIIHLESETKVPRKNLKYIEIMRVMSLILIVLLCVVCMYLEQNNIIGSMWQYLMLVAMVVLTIFLSTSYKTEKVDAEIRIKDEYLEIYEPRKYSQMDGFCEILTRVSYDELEVEYDDFFNLLIFFGDCTNNTKIYGKDSSMTNILIEIKEPDLMAYLEISSGQIDEIKQKLKEFASIEINTDW